MLQEEVWKEIPGFNGRYMVSSLGRIGSNRYSQLKGHYFKILEPHIVSKGYLAAVFMVNKKNHHLSLHRLVAKAFIPGEFEGAQVNHKDLNKQNNEVSNLEWVTGEENIQHYFSNSSSSPNSKLCIDVNTGEVYSSIGKAAQAKHHDRNKMEEKLRGVRSNNTSILVLEDYFK